MQIHSLFPTPIGEFTYGGDISPFRKIINNYERIESRTNRWAEYDVLNFPDFQDLRNFVDKSLDEFYQKIWSPRDDLEHELYITESWVNFTNASEWHHPHNHANSFISGVFYLEAGDAIEFDSPKPSSILEPQTEDWNEFNSSQWWLPARTANLYLFPSWLRHGVPLVKEREEDRISIAFNTFLRGNISMRSTQQLVI